MKTTVLRVASQCGIVTDGFYLREPTTCSEQGPGKKEQLCITIREGLDLLTGWLREYL